MIVLVSSKVKACLAARERVRFCRTRAFGSVRRMIKAMGQNFLDRRIFAHADDIFMLRVDELRDWANSTLSHDDLVCLIAHRKSQIGRLTALESPARFISSRFNVSSSYSEKTGWLSAASAEAEIAGPGARMRGTPCGGGCVIGEAAVVSEPLHAAGKILVTYRTDPGWCAVLPSASALLIERGSPLTHVAIVARELGVPTIIQIKDLTRRVKNGAELEVDGVNGTILVRSNPKLSPQGSESVPVN
jgi:pyruvate,water dikinase